jgi:diguanylate cyclase (GGDEF)-like protein/PAS domain S-box-containing protein
LTAPPAPDLPRKRSAKPSLKLRVLLGAGLAVAFVLLTDAVIRHVQMERDGRRGLVERAMLLASIQGDALSVPMWNLDEDQVGAALDALAADADFVSASVTKPDGQVLQVRRASHAVLARDAHAATIDVQHPIRYLSHGEVRTLGTLHLSLSTTRLKAALAVELEQRAVAFVVLLAAVLLAVYGALRTFTRPLELMAKALTSLAAGDRETPIPASDQDNEVGEVARALQVFRDTAFRLVKAEASYRAVFENAALGIYGTDEKGHMQSCNAALLRICGYASQSELRAALESAERESIYLAPGRSAELLRRLREEQGFDSVLSEIRRGDGTTIWVSQTAQAVRDDSGRVLGFAGTLEDVTDRLRRQGEERLRVRAAMESASDAILIVDETGEPLFANPAFQQTFGCLGQERIRIGALLEMVADPKAAASLSRALRDGLAWEGEADIPTLQSGVKPMLIRASAIRDGAGASFGSVVICTDLSDRRRAEARIQHMAHHDWLTGLPNRALFRDRLNAALETVPRAAVGQDQVSFAVLCIDLDRFKAINDTMGHAAGDALLQLVAVRLQSLVREGDTVARIGGDEFTLIQLGIHQAEQAVALAERLIVDLGEPYTLGGRDVQIGASVGIVLAPLHGSDLDSLLSFGDVALYHAKSGGRCGYSLFSPDMNDLRRERAELEADLRRAVAEERLHLHFQPQFDLASGRLVGAEALLRWTDPARGTVSPGDFIPIAEETGLIDSLGRWVLATACREATRWPDSVRVAVNVSPAQFHAGDLIESVSAILDETGLAPDRLELEITEGVFMRDSEVTRRTLMDLKALGVRITLDDFGTGYSSLSYLRRMPLDKIKVDHSFVAALGHDPAAHALVRSIIGLAKVLGFETNAEGVETNAQAHMLRDEGCQEVQGYYFGRPVCAADFLEFYGRRMLAAMPARALTA